MKVICIGLAVYDVTLPVERFPEENTKTRINAMIEGGGGPASNAAYLLGKWGCDVTFLGMVGDDLHGHAIRKEFEKAGVSTDYLEINTKKKTPIAHVISNQENGSRTILTYREPMQMKKVDVSFTPDILLMDGQEYEMSKALMQEFPDAITVIDASRTTEEVIELASMCNYLVCSKGFAEEMTHRKVDTENIKELEEMYLAMKKQFQNTIVITLEEKGCLYEMDGNIKICASISVTPKDSTGAGDIYHGAFVYGLTKGYSFEELLFLSNVAGALSTEKIGGRNSVPSKAEMRQYIHEFK